jgi:hypothetical protein
MLENYNNSFQNKKLFISSYRIVGSWGMLKYINILLEETHDKNVIYSKTA